jgi:hypothetical protein
MLSQSIVIVRYIKLDDFIVYIVILVYTVDAPHIAAS